MCGICGHLSYSVDTPPDTDLVLRITESLHHRGPDDTGYYSDSYISMGMKRLAIINPELNKQPLHDKQGESVIVFNGEIYNYQEIKDKLSSEGEIFNHTGDTEVILKAYKFWGLDFLNYLNGMFAFAIWDRKTKTLLLVRDYMGQKPLFWSHTKHGLVWSSEVNTLYHTPWIDKKLDPQATDELFNLDFISAPKTISKGVHSLAAGEMLVIQEGQNPKVSRWWNLPTLPKILKSENEILVACKELLTNAVSKTLISDRPVGVFLSGGIDSSIITALASKQTKHQLKTYSLSLDEKDFSEASYAEIVAKHFSTEHSVVPFSAETFKEAAEECIPKLDQPLADPALMPLYKLSKYATKEIKVALTGDGGDETLGGYSRYIADMFIRCIPMRSGILFRLLSKIGTRFCHTNENPDFNILKAISRFASSNAELRDFSFLFWKNNFNPDLWSKLYKSKANQDLYKSIANLTSRTPEGTRLDKTLLQDHAIYLANDLLPKTDRATMLNGLEARAPFLDSEWVKWTAKLPDNYKIRGLQTKWVLRKAFSEILPVDIINRPKRGFNLPLKAWFAKPLRSWILDSILSNDQIKSALPSNDLEYFCKNNIENPEIIWPLCTLAIWLKHNSACIEDL